ncbi:PDZ/DHR/GLGF domain protein [Isosphaera pallida ATCC 43644]|uniref:PDZ/DHR/GLGF domain protein n=1 Tax=Isosphaera pallida (strain ATCC 43644 / DSM 9630 / IS1B) TaxID=575540 RepID=E8QWE5_ISOPI|nr:PDZ domain-containing protein [Isosphaera pallida]ADV60832.1 PDZ/DHR/GLGF domain protein [Isosphaera pallida ATCC 43644]
MPTSLCSRIAPLSLGLILSLSLGLPSHGHDEPTPNQNQAQEAKQTFTVPFVLLGSNHMVIQTKINGKGPYWLLYDVGAPITLIGSKAGMEAGVIKNTNRPALFMGMRGEAKVDRLEVGEAKVENLPVIVMDHPAVKALSTFFRPLQGIIGYTFFARYRSTIDYQAKTLTLEPIANEPKNLASTIEARMTLGSSRKPLERVLNPVGAWGWTVAELEDDAPVQGVKVASVVPGSAVAEAGVQVGDLVTSLDGRWTIDVADLYEAASRIAAPGTPVAVELLRDGKTLRLTITPRPGL